MRIIFFIVVSFFTSFLSIPVHSSEILVCNNAYTDAYFIEKSKNLPEILATSVVLDIEKEKITEVTYVVKAFISGKIASSTKISLVCDVADVKDNRLECIKDNNSFVSEDTQLSAYSYLQISGDLDQTEASLLSELRDGKLLPFSFGSVRIHKTSKGTEIIVNEDQLQVFRCQ